MKTSDCENNYLNDYWDWDHSVEDLLAPIRLCSCGYQKRTYEAIRRYLDLIANENLSHKQKQEKRQALFPGIQDDATYGLYQFMAYVLDRHGFTEHKMFIGDASITPKGQTLRHLLNRMMEEGQDD